MRREGAGGDGDHGGDGEGEPGEAGGQGYHFLGLLRAGRMFGMQRR